MSVEKLYELVALRIGGDRPCQLEPGLICSAGVHLRERGRQADRVCRCPAALRAEARARIDEDVARLRGLVQKVNATGGFGLFGYDPRRHPMAEAALEATWDFCDGRPPTRGLLLAGPLGLGKTRLLLGSHIELLCAGVNSRFVLSSELREFFRDAQSFDEDVHRPARLELERLRQAQVIHWDDVGDVDGDERARGVFVEGIKRLLDTSVATWALTTNLTAVQFASHKDLGEKVLSRVLSGARAIRLEGGDQRLVPLD